MEPRSQGLQGLIDRACGLGPIRVAVADAAQGLVVDTLREAHELGLVEPRLVGSPEAIAKICEDLGWPGGKDWIVPAETDRDATAKAIDLVRGGEADAVMKGNVHTDLFMRLLLDHERGLRTPGQWVSHVFVAETPSRPKLLGITDAAINIASDLMTKAQILRNAVALFRLLGIERPKVAVLSAIETVNPDIASTLDAASLTLMARRGQITAAIVDGPLAFDNAISARAAREKGIVSEVAGEADIVLVPDLVSGNILAKNLQYFAGAVVAGMVMGLAVPAVLSSRADPPPARLAALAIAVLMTQMKAKIAALSVPSEPDLHCAPQPASLCCPIPA